MANSAESLALAEQVLVKQNPVVTAQTALKTTMIQLVGVPQAYTFAEQVLVQVIPAATALTANKQLMIQQPPISSSLAIAEQVLTIPPTNTIDYGVSIEVSSAGLIPANDYNVVVEVLAGIPFDVEDYGVVMEVMAATTLTPAKPMTAIHWFTPS